MATAESIRRAVVIGAFALTSTLLLGVSGLQAQAQTGGVGQLCAYIAEVGLPEPYEREVYRLSYATRPDPTRPPSVIRERDVVLPDMVLTAILYNPAQPARSVAILRIGGDGEQQRLREGDAVGDIQVVSIRSQEVTIRIQQFGQSRTETLSLRR